MRGLIKFFSFVILFILIWAGNALAGQKLFFYHTDPAGTPLVMTDEKRNVVWRAEYKPFGEEFEVTPDPENNKMFVGKEMDKETGLYYFGARYMEPMIGRFVSPDPVGAVDPNTGKTNEKSLRNPQRINLYAYGLNNPFNYIDPDGMEVYFIGAGASASIGNIGPIAKKDQRGYGTQAGYGVAYDTETKKIILFATGGTANQTEDKVIGANVGIGFFGGKIEGNLQDFLGESREISKTFIAVTKTDIETSTNKEGMAFSIGGKGAGFSYTSITTTTFNLTERVKEMTKKEKE